MWSVPTLAQATHFLLSVFGLFISVIVVRQELGFISQTISKFCSSYNSTSCQAVINSRGARIFNYFKLSDLSLSYFGGVTLAWLLTVLFDNNDSILFLLSFLSLPITFYSIYYQYSKVKKWCLLCLGIVLVLWLQSVVAVLENINISLTEIKVDNLHILLISAFLFTSLWLLLKPLLKTYVDYKSLQLQFFKFKRNFDLFYTQYSKGLLIDTGIFHPSEITLGNENAPLQIILVTNPRCHFCKSAHTEVRKILQQNSKNIRLIIRFNLGSFDTTDSGYKVASRLIELYNKGDIPLFFEAIDEAYAEDSRLDEWLGKWGGAVDEIGIRVLNYHQSWCEDNLINFTPALFINGRQFPKEYDKSDLSYFIEDLIECEQNNSVLSEG
ncbi:thioredoxin domain-containing protein [Fulvivirga maritima]|uniref:vitamin K epoxide reductase family protein n=1 Tax=Fulvivirga maritima TaxID=2904247 RepID=UPI001F463A55|nr:vitamin K epoxide reductase family protein [Fulvivirga maritima]UII25816.1 thioredoxin domain-containing protein [Fulvivirga maritima]